MYAFVRGSLREDVKPIKFVLCAWIPRCKPSMNLIYSKTRHRPNANLRFPIPKSVTRHYSTFSSRRLQSSTSNSTMSHSTVSLFTYTIRSYLSIVTYDPTLDVTVPAPLSSDILAHAEDLPIPPEPEASQQASGGRTVGSSGSASASGSRSSGGSLIGGTEIKVPKWLKLGSAFEVFPGFDTKVLTSIAEK